MTTIVRPQQGIRTFVRRQGRISAAYRAALIELAPHYTIPCTGGQLDLDKVFARQAPRILEIGFGNGAALYEMARQQPDHDFLGVEVHSPGIANVFVNARRLGLTNLRVICADIHTVLQQMIPAESFEAVWIFFPDPWPKQRHHKRRLIQPVFIELVVNKLCRGGILHLATDWQDYASQMLKVIASQPRLVNRAGPEQYSARPRYRPLTKYELRGVRQGHVVRDLIFEKN
ncbi:MAG: tRNA (guanosine(46)-N7)-methyltransferase TrmB [Gammaproteobacteria bacterium]|nr:tRNA (guanosine(46)-N7)-methyltransferase TrmB [Gammaproteobacteria bacterium]